jgi:hypothetical protein
MTTITETTLVGASYENGRRLPNFQEFATSREANEDLAMTDPKSLDPETSSLALIGRFLKRVCDLEEKPNEAIAGTLKIDDTKRFILCANIHFREKIHIHSLFRPQFRFD